MGSLSHCVLYWLCGVCCIRVFVIDRLECQLSVVYLLPTVQVECVL